MNTFHYSSRVFLFAFLVAAGLACSPYDAKLLEGGAGGTGPTGGSGGAGNSGDGGSGGACVPDGPDVCGDMKDNDCNGMVNDGQAAIDSCRTLGVVNATSSCTTSGQCLKRSCDPDWFDCDGNNGTGCERAKADTPCGRCGRVCGPDDDAGVLDSGVMMPEGGVNEAGVPEAGVDAAVGSDACVPTSPTTEVCDGVDNDCDSMIDPGTTCPTMCTGVTLPNGKVYAVCRSGLSWGSARTACRVASLGMDLVIIDDDAENTAVDTLINDLIGPTATSWLGANDNVTEGTWLWRDNSQFWMGAAAGAAVGGRYSKWASGQPDDAGGMEDCAQMDATGSWNDLPCGSGASNPYVCEK